MSRDLAAEMCPCGRYRHVMHEPLRDPVALRFFIAHVKPPMGGVADFDEKDTHRRVQEAIPHRPLGTALAPIRYERAGLSQLREQLQRIFEADLLARVRIVEEIASKFLPVWVRVAALHRPSLHPNPSAS